MRFSLIASGSEGNCALIEDAQGRAILIDAGLSMKRIASGLAELGRALAGVQALLISHEHGDHFRGAAVLSRHLDLPIYASAGTITLIKRFFPGKHHLRCLNGQKTTFGGLQIEGFNVNHDAHETLGFVVSEGGRRLGLATDLGVVDMVALSCLRDCDAIVLEANHDLDMLLTGPYPWDLKQRIQSHTGHLSNDQAAEALLQIVSPRLQRVVLAHLSQENNHPDLALDHVRSALHDAGHKHVEVIVASQHQPTGLFEV